MPSNTILASGAFLRPVGPCLHVLLLIHPAKDAGQNAFRPLSRAASCGVERST
ncbi:hypothetical protein FHY12_002121 [Xanthomonas arboricola]|uniref:hypothetical protein n=1 Tax=Xanthomonas euroxanthea TaxID=2259622 RepID=UPI002DD69350|nr:hypothetical protein [Xanthomonas euroxanthea]NIK39796.1 hypothetical protein [Xanthomonas euroxanthea]